MDSSSNFKDLLLIKYEKWFKKKAIMDFCI